MKKRTDMNRVNYYIWKIRLRLCKKFHISHIYKTSKGVKGIYGFPPVLKVPVDNNIITLFANDLYLGVDLLCDDYTLLECPLMQSPHYFFMRAIKEGKPISETDYIKRMKSGTLDARVDAYIKNYQKFYDKYALREGEAESDNYPPVLIYQIGGKKYIYDGKHRAALLAYKERPIRCQLVDNNFWGGEYDLISSDDRYSKHIGLYNQFVENNGKNRK